ncbi:hypothetical protein LB557_04700 [Mesorhizobium sp. BR115XR7A]|uniref:hypothetical protein n=1 Tax=Mesorhizobium sp. BR115XR7A TaxID=2876645 RepID=UPI001CCA95A8|nr:hypothetical protein [Mesorhizobium sp. BR115XR7A]MBZ9905309.1 hypothetical protein [Mesorhizobium sp. BR115XR7A]MBZ9930381.1 hypothetical protein [Mesorhizobium sp. BR1-1-5]
MRTGAGELSYPLPWAGTADTNAIAAPQSIATRCPRRGLEILSERQRRDVALNYFARQRAQAGTGPAADRQPWGRRLPGRFAQPRWKGRYSPEGAAARISPKSDELKNPKPSLISATLPYTVYLIGYSIEDASMAKDVTGARHPTIGAPAGAVHVLKNRERASEIEGRGSGH